MVNNALANALVATSTRGSLRTTMTFNCHRISSSQDSWTTSQAGKTESHSMRLTFSRRPKRISHIRKAPRIKCDLNSHFPSRRLAH